MIDFCLPPRISRGGRLIPHIPIKIRIPRRKPLRILTHKPPNRCIIISGMIVVKPSRRILSVMIMLKKFLLIIPIKPPLE